MAGTSTVKNRTFPLHWTNGTVSAPRTPEAETYEFNAQHGQNRSGVTLEVGRDVDEFDSLHPIDPHAADEREAEEGEDIHARVHARGHDVVAPDEPDPRY